MRLNRFLAHCGVSSRRKADEYIKNGFVTINDKVVTQMGVKINQNDKVKLKNKELSIEIKKYYLLNKPKGYISTLDDEKGRLKVIDLFPNLGFRIYPVGRLDRDTTGLLLLTNDGDLCKKLSHPEKNIQKIYKVKINNFLNQDDIIKLKNGIVLEDGISYFDNIEETNEFENEYFVTLHSGKNRIIRRMFEALNFKIISLDRINFAGLNKKNLLRGRWRELSIKEIGYLKML